MVSNDNFFKLEKEVMQKLLDGNDQSLEILRKQYVKATIKERKFTGVGFFTDFNIADDAIIIDKAKSLQIGDVIGKIKGVKYGVGFVLFVKNGVISFLEGYTYGDEKWPEQINQYKLSYISGKKRDFETLGFKLS